MSKKILLVLVGLLVFSCTRDSHPDYYGTVKPKHPFDEIWINNREEPQYLDPTLVNGVPGGHLARNTFSRLTALDPKTGETIPELAERWEVSKDGTKYKFFMRKGLQWSDGQPITAEDAAYAWVRLIDPMTGATYQGLGSNVIQNGDAFAQQAIHIFGSPTKLSSREINSFLVKHEIPAQKIEERKNTNDLFVFVTGKTPEGTKQNRDRLIQLVKEFKPWGSAVSAKYTTAEVLGIKVVDDRTIEFTLTGPIPYFVLLTEFANFAPLPKHVIEKFKAQGKEEQWVLPENMVVSGPFKIKEERFKQYKLYEKNPKYWDAANVRLNRVKVVMVETEMASLNSYKVGEQDWTGPHILPSEQIPRLKKFKDYFNDPYLGMYYYVVNTKVKPLDDVRVRRALNLAIDRQKITDHVLGGGQIPYTGIVPNDLAGFQSHQSELFNPQKAKMLLAEAGFPDGEGFPKLNFLYDTKDMHRLIIQAVQEMWKKNLNIDIEPTNVEWKVYLDRKDSKDFEIARQGWIGDFMDPFTFLELLYSTSGNNDTSWSNAEYDKLIDASNQEANQEKRLALMSEAEKIAVEESPYIPIYLYTKTYMLKPYVKGFYQDYQDHHEWKYMWIDLDWHKTN